MPRTKTTRTVSGDGSIYYNESKKKWVAEIHWTDASGKRQRKNFSGSKQLTVKNNLKEFKKQLLLDSSSLGKNDVPFQTYCDNWMKTKQANKLKPTSYDRKYCTLKNQVYPIIGQIPINKLSHADVQNMVNQLRDDEKSYSTIKKAVEAISGCMRAYRIQTKSSINPCEGIELPENIRKQSGEIKYFNAEERKKIVDVTNLKYNNGKPIYRLGPIIIVLMYTGMRIGELIALTWNDVDLTNKTITISKNAVLVRDRS